MDTYKHHSMARRGPIESLMDYYIPADEEPRLDVFAWRSLTTAWLAGGAAWLLNELTGSNALLVTLLVISAAFGLLSLTIHLQERWREYRGARTTNPPDTPWWSESRHRYRHSDRSHRVDPRVGPRPNPLTEQE